MATVIGVTAQRAEDIEDRLIVSATRQGTSLVLNTFGGSTVSVPNAFPPLYETYPIGSIYMSDSSANPSTYMGGGTWVRWGKGRVPVGVDENDTDFDSPNKEGGEKKVTLSVNEIPSHDHGWAANTGGINQAFTSLDSILVARAGSGAVNHYSSGNGAIGETGGGLPHNNLQPYITVYMWRRTA